MSQEKCTKQIAILMATYNGSSFLHEQIDSILGQSFTDWHLYVHDDGSKDNTPCILEQYQKQYHDQITLLNYPAQGNACQNFLSILERIEAPYYMFSDQDDVWLPEKIAKTFSKIKYLEREFANTPIIVHSDLYITDQLLNITSRSFIKNQQIKIDRIKSFADYSATNTVTGCTMLFNAVAKQNIKRPYDKAIMHDAWICLSVAAKNGIVDFIDEPLIKYRQHHDNTLGACDMSQQTLLHKLKNIHQLFKDDMAHYQEMNAVKHISIWEFTKAKIRYKRK